MDSDQTTRRADVVQHGMTCRDRPHVQVHAFGQDLGQPGAKPICDFLHIGAVAQYDHEALRRSIHYRRGEHLGQVHFEDSGDGVCELADRDGDLRVHRSRWGSDEQRSTGRDLQLLDRHRSPAFGLRMAMCGAPPPRHRGHLRAQERPQSSRRVSESAWGSSTAHWLVPAGRHCMLRSAGGPYCSQSGQPNWTGVYVPSSIW